MTYGHNNNNNLMLLARYELKSFLHFDFSETLFLHSWHLLVQSQQWKHQINM